MIPCGPCLELLGFCPPLGQFSGVQWKWLQSIAPPTSPGGSWRRILSLFSMPIVLAVVVSSSNLVPSVGTMGMQCVGKLYCLDLIEIPSYPFSLFKAERSKIIPCTAVNPPATLELHGVSVSFFSYFGNFPVESPVKPRVHQCTTFCHYWPLQNFAWALSSFSLGS